MTTFASMQFFVTAQTLHTVATPQTILEALVARPPQAFAHSSGWRGVTDSLDEPSTDVSPGDTPPELWAASAEVGIPERLAARYVWWFKTSLASDSENPASAQWQLDGIDVIISPAAGGFLLMWSSQDSHLVAAPGQKATGRAVQALLDAVRSVDANARITSGSVLTIDRDSYLWLTNSMGTPAGIGGGVHIEAVSGMGTDEMARGSQRTSMLSGSIDMERVSFISAISMSAPLGPATVDFSERNEEGKNDLTRAKIFVDGSFKPAIGPCHYPATMLSGLEKRLEVVHRIAYRYIPQVQAGFANDREWVDTGRDMLLVEKQIQLARDFRDLAERNPQYASWLAENPQS